MADFVLIACTSFAHRDEVDVPRDPPHVVVTARGKGKTAPP